MTSPRPFRSVPAAHCLLGIACCSYFCQQGVQSTCLSHCPSLVVTREPARRNLRQARVILGVVRGACTGIICDLMLLIEGCQPDELPERMIGGARLLLLHACACIMHAGVPADSHSKRRHVVDVATPARKLSVVAASRRCCRAADAVDAARGSQRRRRFLSFHLGMACLRLSRVFRMNLATFPPIDDRAKQCAAAVPLSPPHLY